ncbi:uncharacterized protein [Struthio camelus]|uniref:uncharacterized protein isoform X2 n=1 Tax=Struthio camelus TaxID=8801 RepID=UPI003603E662
MGSLTDLQCPQCVCTASLSPAYEDGEEHGGRPNSRICLKQPGSFLLLGLGSSGDPEGGQMLGGPEILLRIWRGKIPRRSGKNLAAASFSYHTGWCIQEPPPKAAPPRTCPEDLWSTGDAGMRGPDSLHQGCATARAPAAWKPDLWPDDPNLRLPAGTSRPGWLEGRCSPQLTQVSHPRLVSHQLFAGLSAHQLLSDAKLCTLAEAGDRSVGSNQQLRQQAAANANPKGFEMLQAGPNWDARRRRRSHAGFDSCDLGTATVCRQPFKKEDNALCAERLPPLPQNEEKRVLPRSSWGQK